MILEFVGVIWVNSSKACCRLFASKSSKAWSHLLTPEDFNGVALMESISVVEGRFTGTGWLMFMMIRFDEDTMKNPIDLINDSFFCKMMIINKKIK